MATELTSAGVKVTATSSFANALDLSTITDTLRLPVVHSFTDGTGAGKAEITWHDQRTLAAEGTDNLDLAGGVSHAFGTATFTKVKALVIQNTTTTTGLVLHVGGAASNPISTLTGATNDVIVVGAGGTLVLTAPTDGYVITGGSADVLKVYNPHAETAVTYDIVVIGEGT
jgi:hypothetical protein